MRDNSRMPRRRQSLQKCSTAGAQRHNAITLRTDTVVDREMMPSVLGATATFNRLNDVRWKTFPPIIEVLLLSPHSSNPPMSIDDMKKSGTVVAVANVTVITSNLVSHVICKLQVTPYIGAIDIPTKVQCSN